MVAYAYLRVSTDHQDLDNQRHGILEYANHHGLSSLQFVEDRASGNLKWRSRAIGKLLLERGQQLEAIATYDYLLNIDPNYQLAQIACTTALEVQPLP